MISHPYCESATVTVRVDFAMGYEKRTSGGGKYGSVKCKSSVRKN